MKAKLIISCILLVAALTSASAGPGKTDLAKENLVEDSTPDFVLGSTNSVSVVDHVITFDLSPPAAGKFTVLCYVNGKVFERKEMNLPGTYSVSMRGLSPGNHKVTVQAIDSQGRVGHISKKIRK